MSKELEQGVKSGASEGCCGGPAPTGIDACCITDATAKAAGDDGCGCSSESTESAKEVSTSCC